MRGMTNQFLPNIIPGCDYSILTLRYSFNLTCLGWLVSYDHLCLLCSRALLDAGEAEIEKKKNQLSIMSLELKGGSR